MILTETASILTGSPGSMAYHVVLVTIFAVMLVLANAARPRPRLDSNRKWALAAGGMLTCRLLGMVVAGLAWLLVIDGNVFLPVTERFLNFIGVALFAWVVIFPRGSRRADFLLFVVLMLAIMGLGITFLALLGEFILPPFNRSFADAGWTVAGGLLALLACIALMVRKPFPWASSLAAFAALTAGYVLHMTIGPVEGALPGFVRWGELAAYPLLAFSSAQIFQLREEKERKEPVPAPGAEKAPDTGPQYDTIRELIRLISEDTLESLARSMVVSVGSAMRAEICLLLSPPDREGKFSIAMGYDLIREETLPGASLNLEMCPVIHSAFVKQQSLRLPPTSKAPDLETLRRKLQLPSTGPLLLAPLLDEGRLMGGLLLLSPYVRARWVDKDLEAVMLVSEHLARRLGQLQSSSRRTEEPSEELQETLHEAVRQIEQLQIERSELIEKARLEMEELHLQHESEISDLLETNEAAQARIEELEAHLQDLQSMDMAPDRAAQLVRLEEIGDEAITPEEVAQARETLQKRDAGLVSRDEFTRKVAADIDAIASVALNIRQPMSTVLGYAELMLTESTGALTDTQRRLLGQLVGAVERMQALADQLNRYALIDTGILGLTAQSVDLIAAFERVVTRVGEPLRSKRLALRMDLPDELPHVQSDPDAISQIMSNLLTNAIDSSPPGEEIVLVARIQEAEQAEYLLLTVSNLGQGIPPEELAMLYSRASGREKKPPLEEEVVHGRLIVVQALVHAIGGRVWFDSEVGVGTTVTILLPLIPSDPEGQV
jgi:signal transduction histidine kinase